MNDANPKKLKGKLKKKKKQKDVTLFRNIADANLMITQPTRKDTNSRKAK
jgi:hypothetical protein